MSGPAKGTALYFSGNGGRIDKSPLPCGIIENVLTGISWKTLMNSEGRQLWKRLCPRATATTLYELAPGFFLTRGIRGLIIDLDNTLVAWGEDKISRRMREWVREIQAAGLKICILSNALEHRVRAVGENLGIPWVSRAVKPRKHPFRQALKILGTSPQETAVIGDQIFTDIWGGNRMRLYTIWTTPLSTEEFISTKAVRRLERLVVKKFRKKGILQ